MPAKTPSTLTYTRLTRLIARATPLWPQVRAASPTSDNARSTEEVRRILEAWNGVLRCADLGGLDRRLELDGVTREQAADALRRGPVTKEALPGWTLALERVLEACEQCEIQWRPTSDLPFDELFQPFAETALELLRERDPSIDEIFTAEAVAELDSAMRRQLSELCAFALEFEYSRYRQAAAAPMLPESCLHYRGFVQHMAAEGLAGFFEEYSALARLVGTAIERWVSALAEFITYLEEDRHQIETVFHNGAPLGRIEHASIGLSDLHEEGRRVILAHFAGGAALAYKPRSIALDRVFYNLLHWINQRSGLLPLYVPRVLDKQSHGWVELIRREDCGSEAEVSRYYRRCGMLLALASVLRGTDFHYGNLIARGEHPVLIDLESLLAGRLAQTTEEDADPGNAMLLEVVRTGLLPNHQVGPKDRIFDVSGLAGSGGQETGFTVPQWLHVNTDAMSLSQRIGTTSPHDNAPRLGGRIVWTSGFEDEIIKGFREMGCAIIELSSALLAQGGPIEAFRGLPARFVFRPTSLYHLLLRGTLTPDLLRDGVARSIQLEALARFLIRRAGHEKVWPLLGAELQAMEDGEVPFFATSTDGTDVSVMGCKVAGDVLEGASYDAVRSRIRKLDRLLVDDQVQAVRWALSHHAIDRCPALPQADSESDGILQGAVAIGNQLAERALECPGGAGWFGPHFTEEANTQSIRPLGWDLYSGAPGIAVFLAALARVQDGVFGELARRTVQASRYRIQQLEDGGVASASMLGGATGDASLLYAWLSVGALLKDQGLVDTAVSLARRIDPRAFPDNAPLDIVRGAAGTLMCLLAVYARSGERLILQRAEDCGRLLLARRERPATGESAWRSPKGQLLTGFAHGSSGIAFALLRLYEARRESDFLEAAFEAIAYENRGFDVHRKGWPDLRFPLEGPSKSFGNAWCHGSTGIGILRLEALRHESCPQWLDDVETALSRVNQETSPLDQMCCGHAGRLELLIRAQRQLGRPELGECASRVARALLTRASERGRFCLGSNNGLWNPGLFLGTAGIGYQLLRVASPATVPSLLTWETPNE